jgi:hypothetical protein
VEDGPDEQVRPDLAPALLVVGRVREIDDELPGADRVRGEARAREVLEELAEELGIPDLDSDGPQFASTSAGLVESASPFRGLSSWQRLADRGAR